MKLLRKKLSVFLVVALIFQFLPLYDLMAFAKNIDLSPSNLIPSKKVEIQVTETSTPTFTPTATPTLAANQKFNVDVDSSIKHIM